MAKLLDEEDEIVRTTAMAALRNLGLEARVPVLIGSLRDKEEGIRQQAAAELAKLGPKAKAAIPALGRALDDPNSKVCNEVALALGPMGKDGVPPLVEFLKSKSKNREFAAKALGEIGPNAKAAIPVLGKLVDDSDEMLQSAATTALHNLGPEARLPALIGSLRDKNVEMRAKAARALGTMGPEAKSAIPALLTAFAKDHSIYGSFDFNVSSRVAWQFYDAYETALRRIGKHDVPLLIEILTNTKDKIKNDDGVQENWLIHVIVSSTLAEIGLPDAKAAIPVLIELRQERRCWVSASLALGKIGWPDEAKATVPALLDVLAGFNRFSRFEFEADDNYLKAKLKAEAMARRQDRELRPRLSVEVRERLAIRTLEVGIVKKEIIVRREIPLDAFFNERGNERVRISAVAALKAMGKDAVPPLIEILKGESKHRPLAAIVLVELFPDEAKEATPIFVDLIRNAKTHKAVYAYSLGRLGGPQAKAALPHLVGVLGDDDDFVQEATAAAIRSIGKDAVPNGTADWSHWSYGDGSDRFVRGVREQPTLVAAKPRGLMMTKFGAHR